MEQFTIANVGPTPYLYVERSCNMDEIAAAMGSAFETVWAFMSRHGIQPAGGALAVYYDYSPDPMTFRAGFTVAEPDLGAAEGEVLGDRTPEGRVVRGTHRGSYAGLQEAYGRMAAFVKAKGADFIAPTWEIYLNSPDQVPEDQLLTELYQAITG